MEFFHRDFFCLNFESFFATNARILISESLLKFYLKQNTFKLNKGVKSSHWHKLQIVIKKHSCIGGNLFAKILFRQNPIINFKKL